MPTTTYIPLGTITLTANASEISFTGIPSSLSGQNFRDLLLVANLRNNYAGSSNDSVAIRLNGDTGANYSWVRLFGTGSGGGQSTAGIGDVAMYLGRLVENNNASGLYGINTIHIMDYTATDKHKSAVSRASVPDQVIYAVAGRWANTSVVTSITITANSPFVSGCTAALYGVAA